MTNQEEPDWLKSSRKKGYLLSKGRERARAVMEKLWQRDCLCRRQPFVVVGKRYPEIRVELTTGWWLSRRLWSALQSELSNCGLQRTGNSFRVEMLASQAVESTADRLLELLHLYRPSPAEAFDLPPTLVRGYARCVSSYAMEHCMTEGELYFIREIPNNLGHVLALRTNEFPVVGVHLERFGLLAP